MPMVMITGQKAIRTARQARFQIVDVIASMKPLTKLTRQIVSPGAIPTVVRDAFRVACEERPGPVHLELPEDVAVTPLKSLGSPVTAMLSPPSGRETTGSVAATPPVVSDPKIEMPRRRRSDPAGRML